MYHNQLTSTVSHRLGIATALIAALVAVSARSSLAAPPTSVPSRQAFGRAPRTRIKIVIEKRGTIVAELFPSIAPKTVAHIVALVRRKYYDHLLFHSVTRDFMAITGDPKSRSIEGSKIANLSNAEIIEKYKLGSGGSGSTVPLEPGIGHVRGSLGLMRRLASINSGDSQIFFNLDNNHTNDVTYCAFGLVVQGMDVMSRISQGDRIESIRIVPAPLPAYQQPPAKKKP